MADTAPLPPEIFNDYNGDRLEGLAIAFIPILLCFVGLRFWSRHLSATKLGLDDVLVVVSTVLQLGESALAIVFIRYGGVGRHFIVWERTDPAVATRYFKYLLAVSFQYFVCVGVPKLAILAFYHRIFAPKKYRITIYILAAVVAVTGLICSVMSLSLCRPFEYNWNRRVEGSCVNKQDFYRWGSLPNILTDVVMLALPAPVVWKLHAPLKLKLGLSVAFAAGSLGLATSILRFSEFFRDSAVEDGTWSSVSLMIWCIVETNVYLIAACLPTYRPVLIHLFGSGVLSQSQRQGAHGEAAPRAAAKFAHKSRGLDKSRSYNDADDLALVELKGGGRRWDVENPAPNHIHLRTSIDVNVSAR
ncbi:hypothetical protein QQS21_005647 [Conoideocrella luteorostrata]|uniref:Rhodopsin domain-containing protein n=1 Tax=Conoideocrella luteorostrata TaxID=1105319 RepID=A0AAJ0CP23_9HYPO|nr:hypothetical protein QQS21_005647 [Conoideocrella luteorostrata]